MCDGIMDAEFYLTVAIRFAFAGGATTYLSVSSKVCACTCTVGPA